MRLLSLLASPGGHFILHACSARSPLSVSVPLLFLFALSILQGALLFGGLVHLPSVLLFRDKLVI